MTGSPKIEFKRDAAPWVRSKLPWRKPEGDLVASVADRNGGPVFYDAHDDDRDFILTAVNERAAMLAELDRRAAEIDALRAKLAKSRKSAFRECALMMDDLHKKAKEEAWSLAGEEGFEGMAAHHTTREGAFAEARDLIRKRSTP